MSDYLGLARRTLAALPSSLSAGGAPEDDSRIIRALHLLNLAGCRMIRQGDDIGIGIWKDMDGPELRAALQVVALDRQTVLYLDEADVPARYRVRCSPERRPGESFEAWQRRAERLRE